MGRPGRRGGLDADGPLAAAAGRRRRTGSLGLQRRAGGLRVPHVPGQHRVDVDGAGALRRADHLGAHRIQQRDGPLEGQFADLPLRLLHLAFPAGRTRHARDAADPPVGTDAPGAFRDGREPALRTSGGLLAQGRRAGLPGRLVGHGAFLPYRVMDEQLPRCTVGRHRLGGGAGGGDRFRSVGRQRGRRALRIQPRADGHRPGNGVLQTGAALGRMGAHRHRRHGLRAGGHERHAGSAGHSDADRALLPDDVALPAAAYPLRPYGTPRPLQLAPGEQNPPGAPADRKNAKITDHAHVRRSGLADGSRRGGHRLAAAAGHGAAQTASRIGDARSARSERTHRPADGRDGRLRICGADDQLRRAGHRVERPHRRGHPALGHPGAVGGAADPLLGAGAAMPAVRRRRPAGAGLQHIQHGGALVPGGLSARLPPDRGPQHVARPDLRRLAGGIGRGTRTGSAGGDRRDGGFGHHGPAVRTLSALHAAHPPGDRHR